MIILKNFDTGKRTLSLYLSLVYTSFRYSEAWPPPIKACKIDELPKAYMAELLITKQDPNSCDRVGKSPTNLEAMSLNYWNIVDLNVISQFMQWIRSQAWSEIKFISIWPTHLWSMWCWFGCTDIGSTFKFILVINIFSFIKTQKQKVLIKK